ncbi:MAG: hypothetical protein ACE5JG_08580 [Planctomycetota bacterium]
MSEPTRHDDPELHEEIRAALLCEAVGDEERAAMARAALERAREPQPRRRRIGKAAPWLAGAAAAAAVVVAVVGGEGPGVGASQPGESTVESERARNLEFLRSKKVQKHLADNPGLWAAVAGGDNLFVSAPLEKVLAQIEKVKPDAKHRFVWKVGEEGDVAYDFTVGDQPWAGMEFLEQTGLWQERDRQPGWWFYRQTDPKKKARFPPGKDKRPWLPIVVGVPGLDEGTTITFVVSTGSNCPLLLPEGHRFPLAEIPGEAVVTSVFLHQTQWRLRRYLVRARIPELGVDTVVEALELTQPVKKGEERLVLGEVPWHPYEDEVFAVAKRSRKPLLFLIGPEPGPEVAALFSPPGDLSSLLGAFVLVYPGSKPVDKDPAIWGGMAASPSAPLLIVVYPQRGGPKLVKTGENLRLTKRTKPAELRAFLERGAMPKK